MFPCLKQEKFLRSLGTLTGVAVVSVTDRPGPGVGDNMCHPTGSVSPGKDPLWALPDGGPSTAARGSSLGPCPVGRGLAMDPWRPLVASGGRYTLGTIPSWAEASAKVVWGWVVPPSTHHLQGLPFRVSVPTSTSSPTPAGDASVKYTA